VQLRCEKVYSKGKAGGRASSDALALGLKEEKRKKISVFVARNKKGQKELSRPTVKVTTTQRRHRG